MNQKNGQTDPGPVRASGGFEDLEHAGHGRPPAALAVGVQQGTQAVAPRGLVLRVDPLCLFNRKWAV